MNTMPWKHGPALSHSSKTHNTVWIAISVPNLVMLRIDLPFLGCLIKSWTIFDTDHISVHGHISYLSIDRSIYLPIFPWVVVSNLGPQAPDGPPETVCLAPSLLRLRKGDKTLGGQSMAGLFVPHTLPCVSSFRSRATLYVLFAQMHSLEFMNIHDKSWVLNDNL